MHTSNTSPLAIDDNGDDSIEEMLGVDQSQSPESNVERKKKQSKKKRRLNFWSLGIFSDS